MSIGFEKLCHLSGLPEPVPEYRFHPERRWRFDWAFVHQRLALEVQGGIFIQGRHSRGASMVREFEKLNAAAALGYRVVFCTPKQIANGEALDIVEKALR